MNITLAQVKAFERIARLGSFHAAARQLFVTQPSVSQRIHDLEDQLGVQLFLRRGPKISLTAQGLQFLSFADRMLNTVEQLTEQFRTNAPLNGTLRFGVNESFGLICLSDLMQRLEQRYPNLKTLIQVGDSGTISRLLDEQQLDLAIVSDPDVSREVEREPIGANELGWFASADFAISHTSLDPTDLCPYHLIISPPPSRLYTTAMSWFAKAGVTPQHLSMCNSLSVTKLTILRGLGIGLMPAGVIQDELSRGLVCRLNTSPPVPSHKVWICYRQDQFGTDIQKLVDLVRDVADEHRLFR